MRMAINKTLRSALLESGLVVLGVVLAYLANDWHEQSEHRQRAAEAERSIVAELKSNREAAQRSMDYHQGLLDKLGKPDAALGPQDFSRGFVFPAVLQRTAWESAAQTGVLQYLSYACVLEWSRAYAQQQRYDEQARSVGALIYERLFDGGHAALTQNARGLKLLINAFAYRESQLVETYSTLLARPVAAGGCVRG